MAATCWPDPRQPWTEVLEPNGENEDRNGAGRIEQR